MRVVAINFFIFAISAELACLLCVSFMNWPSSRPSYRLTYNLFWADINPVFGVWHRPNGHFLHKGGCYSVEYYTNSCGARDRERDQHSSLPRTVVLGDSFIEGFGLQAENRLSDLLEVRTGREHLNFGAGGDFGPLQYALLYKTMAASFDHDTVLVGILPDNDFHDMSLPWGKTHHVGRYRPYYSFDGDNISIIYGGQFKPEEGLWDRVEAFLRAYLASYHVGQYIYSRMYWHLHEPYSGYNDYTETDLMLLKKALLDIMNTAKERGAKTAILLIPRANDFMRFHSSGSNRLGPVMESWGQSLGIPVKDLLPEMQEKSYGDFRPYFLECDGHWSSHGNAVASEIIESWLYPLTK